MVTKEKSHACHGGELAYYTHDSRATGTSMRFTVFHPSKNTCMGAAVLFLSGLTCTEDNFTTKAGAYKRAAELGLTVIAPDTSPRGENVPDHDDYDLGQGAGFYIDATEKPWSDHFKMESYVIKDLIPLIQGEFDLKKISIMGHSMGGHGALTLYFKYPELFQSASAFAPIVAPSQVPWGHKAFTAYLGDNQDAWKDHDACALVRGADNPILIDQGMADDFLSDQLKPELFEQACKDAGQSLIMRRQDGYDHSYFFISTFIDDHLDHHVKYLG